MRGDDDKWANEVYSRLAFASDCCAYDVVDHNVCSTNFGKDLEFPRLSLMNHRERSQKVVLKVQ